MASLPKVRRPALGLGLIAVLAGSAALWSFPRAMPMLAVGQRLSRQAALARADSFFLAHDLAPPAARRAVRFQGNDSLRTYLDLAGGGRDTLNAILRGRDVALYTWSVRAFVPRDPHEARVDFAPDGRVVGFRRKLAEADARPAVTVAAGQRQAELVLTSWLGEDGSRWRLITSSYQTRKASGRVDRTYTFERTDRRIAGAPIRLDIVIAGDLPAGAHPYVVVPESFRRRYGEMRSANDLLALIAQVGMVVLLILGIVVLWRGALRHEIRWRPALFLGGVVGTLIVAAGLNQIPGSWFGYDTATSPTTFLATLVLGALAAGAGEALLVGLTVAAAEAATRRAFPPHLDWWRIWDHRGTLPVAGRVASGYVVALIGFAYVGLFYLVTRHLLGWWVPSELLDDPNLISTPAPWLSGIAMALHAGVWEESLFRALPLSLLAWWVRDRPHRGRWLALGVVGTALIFGFAHSNYPSWPPYSRGVELLLEASFWAVLFLWLGLLVTVIAHFTFDLVLFGSFAASGSALQYHITAVIIGLALLAPALAVAWRWVRQRRLAEFPDTARFGAWQPGVESQGAPPLEARSTRQLTPRARNLAVGAAVIALILEIVIPSAPRLGPSFTVGRAVVLAAADSVARRHGIEPGDWKQLVGTGHDTPTGWARFLVEEQATSLAQAVAASYDPPAWWVVRFVHTGGTAASRAEEWQIRLWPDGVPLDIRHIIPDSAGGDTVSAAVARRLAHAALAARGLDTLVLQESDLEETERPARRDVTVVYTDTAMKLPGDAKARVRVTLAGDQTLGVRRNVELPESFQRAERERQATDMLIALIGVGLGLLMVVGGAILMIRRRSPLLADGVLGWKASLLAVGALAVLAVAAALESLPARLAEYDTAMPWSNWVGINVVVALLAVVPALVVGGLWLVLGALRRRAGIPLFPVGSGREERRDVLLAGLGLGGMLTLLGLGQTLLHHSAVPGPPTTLLDQAVPLVSEALSIPLLVVVSVAALAIPALVVIGLARRAGTRLLLAAALAAPLFAVFVLLSPPGSSPLLRGLELGVTAVVLGALAVHYWAAYCGWSWVVAGLFYAGFGAVRSVFHAPTGIERGGAVVTLAVILGLLVLAGRIAGWQAASDQVSAAETDG